MIKYWFEESVSNIRHGGIVSLLSVIIITLTVIILSSLIIIRNHLHREMATLKEDAPIIAFLDDNLNIETLKKLRIDLQRANEISSITYVSKEAALKKSQDTFGKYGKAIMEGFADINPLPASFEIYVNELTLNSDALPDIAGWIDELEGIEDVTYEQYSSNFINKAEMVILIFSVLMGGASIVIVAFSIMLTVYFRREEIKILRMVGAGNLYIILPLVTQGIFLGFIGSILGLWGMYLIFYLFSQQIGDIEFITSTQFLSIIGIGTLLGLIGSLLPIKRYIEV
ncbi:TPA: FtsX-like permease family protein [Candidatus Poribacteria bacterium]|nr:FtsX-like permease family protein [Candidatus Poribacteria bacterium]